MSIEILAAKAAIANMVKKGRVDICAIREVQAILGIHNRGKSYGVLSALHCIDFSDMETALQQAIPDLVADALQDDRMDWSQVFADLNCKMFLPPQKTLLARLLKG